MSEKTMSENTKIEDTGLLPCPFCGAPAKVTKSWMFGWDIKCVRCGVCPTNNHILDTYEEAKAIWNSWPGKESRQSARSNNPQP